MLISNLTTLHLWGRVLAKFQEVRTIAYEDDGYMKTNMSVTIQVLTELKRVLKEDGGLDLNVSKTSVLPKGVTQLFCWQLFFFQVAFTPCEERTIQQYCFNTDCCHPHPDSLKDHTPDSQGLEGPQKTFTVSHHTEQVRLMTTEHRH
jgi:hypothetical protein